MPYSKFMQINDLQQNPLVQRVIDLFDSDGNGEVDFKEFIEGISQFSVRGDKQAKLTNRSTEQVREMCLFVNT